MTTVCPLGDLLAKVPYPTAGGAKGERGTLVIVGGSEQCPGAALLAGVAALRAGIGRVQLVTAPAVAKMVAVALPEALVTGWDGTTPDDAVGQLLGQSDAVCVGPGLGDDAVAWALATAPHVPAGAPLLLDALAIGAAGDLAVAGRDCAISPNVAEAQQLLGTDDDDVERLARFLVEKLGERVAVRGAVTVVIAGGQAYQSPGAPGLGIPGSGDVLAGIAGALLAQSVEPPGALAWATCVHAESGLMLAGGRDRPGYLARELLTAIPDAVEALTAGRY